MLSEFSSRSRSREVASERGPTLASPFVYYGGASIMSVFRILGFSLTCRVASYHGALHSSRMTKKNENLTGVSSLSPENHIL